VFIAQTNTLFEIGDDEDVPAVLVLVLVEGHLHPGTLHCSQIILDTKLSTRPDGYVFNVHKLQQ